MSPRYLDRALYHRDLPHRQNGAHPLFVTMSTFENWYLPPLARDIVLHHIRRQDGVRLNLAVVVVMPEHVHIVFRPMEGHFLAEILDSIRGPSAHEINKSLGRRGPVWNRDFFDRLIRGGEFDSTINYVWLNPVHRGLCREPDQYRWLWIADGL